MNLIKRNLPVLIIGVVTLLIFVGIIVISQNNPSTNDPTLNQAQDELITTHTYTLGNVGAPITIVEFSDFQCPFCKEAQPVLKSLYESFPNQLLIAFRHFPLPQHPSAKKAAEAAQAAGEQGKFWEYVDMLFANNEKLDEESLVKYSTDLGLDSEKLKTALDKNTYASIVNSDVKTALKLNLPGTPSFYLNGKLMQFSTLQDLETQIRTAITNSFTEGSIKDINQSTQTTETPDTNTDTSTGNITAVEIAYTASGFSPDLVTVQKNSYIKIINKTTSSITFVQDKLDYQGLGLEKPLESNQGFELKMTNTGFWGFSEKASGKKGSVTVYP